MLSCWSHASRRFSGFLGDSCGVSVFLTSLFLFRIFAVEAPLKRSFQVWIWGALWPFRRESMDLGFVSDRIQPLKSDHSVAWLISARFDLIWRGRRSYLVYRYSYGIAISAWIKMGQFASSLVFSWLIVHARDMVMLLLLLDKCLLGNVA